MQGCKVWVNLCLIDVILHFDGSKQLQLESQLHAHCTKWTNLGVRLICYCICKTKNDGIK